MSNPCSLSTALHLHLSQSGIADIRTPEACQPGRPGFSENGGTPPPPMRTGLSAREKWGGEHGQRQGAE